MTVRLVASGDHGHRLQSGSRVIEAVWEEDRWLLAMGIGTSDPDASTVLDAGLVAEQGGSCELGPLLNPVFQQAFSRVNGEGIGEILLVGQHGLRHFSAVLRLSDREVCLEVADRWTAALPIGQFQLTWKTVGIVSIDASGAATIRGDDGNISLVALATGGRLNLVDGRQLLHLPALTVGGGRLTVACQPGQVTVEPGTFQYGVRALFA
ncbi:MAG: hypothetical protein U1D30_04670 [Planctomycetota bacterium]